MAGDVRRRHAMGFQRELALLGTGGGKPLGCKSGDEQAQQNLGTVALDGAVDVDLRFGELGRLANRLGGQRDIGAAGVALQFDRRSGPVAVPDRGQADMHVERRRGGKLLRLGHAFGHAQQLAADAKAVGGRRLQGEIHLARRRLAQMLDVALAVERDARLPAEKSRRSTSRVSLGEGEFRIELARRNVGQQQLADAEGDMGLVVAERGDEVRLGCRASSRFAVEAGSQERHATLSPSTSRRSRRSLSRLRSITRLSPP